MDQEWTRTEKFHCPLISDVLWCVVYSLAICNATLCYDQLVVILAGVQPAVTGKFCLNTNSCI